MLVIKLRHYQPELNNYYGPMKAAKECQTTKWPLPGNKLGLIMCMSKQPIATLKKNRGANEAFFYTPFFETVGGCEDVSLVQNRAAAPVS